MFFLVLLFFKQPFRIYFLGRLWFAVIQEQCLNCFTHLIENKICVALFWSKQRGALKLVSSCYLHFTCKKMLQPRCFLWQGQKGSRRFRYWEWNTKLKCGGCVRPGGGVLMQLWMLFVIGTQLIWWRNTSENARFVDKLSYLVFRHGTLNSWRHQTRDFCRGTWKKTYYLKCVTHWTI